VIISGGRVTKPATKYLEWKRTKNDVACRFARYLAINPTQFGQRLEVVKGADGAALAGEIDTLVTTFIADPDAVAVTLVLPDVTKARTLVDLALDLSKRDGWTVKRWALARTRGGAMVAFGVARDVQLATGRSVPSEALVLGPIRGFPATRKAPITALEMFVGVPPELNRDGKPADKANLADVNVIPPLAQAHHDHMWTSTQRVRKEILGETHGKVDLRAKAKVAFVVSAKLAQSMGCAP